MIFNDKMSVMMMMLIIAMLMMMTTRFLSLQRSGWRSKMPPWLPPPISLLTQPIDQHHDDKDDNDNDDDNEYDNYPMMIMMTSNCHRPSLL